MQNDHYYYYHKIATRVDNGSKDLTETFNTIDI